MREFWGEVTAQGYVAAACLPLVLACWLNQAVKGRPLLPPQRQRLVNWDVLEVFLALPVVQMAAISAALLLAQTGLLRAVYGADFPPTPEPKSAASYRLGVWAQVLGYPPGLALVLGLLYALRGTRPYQLGLTRYRAGALVVVGYGAWLLLTPLTHLVNVLVVWLTLSLGGTAPDDHVLKLLVSSEALPIDWVMLVLGACVAAPVVEELVFRGIVQPWLVRYPWGAALAYGVALTFTLSPARQDQQLAAAFFVIALLPGLWYAEWLAWRWLPVPNAARAICASSLVWAMLHANVWPSPVPLFVLGLGLGYVAYRTQSLVAPILAHALFNLVTVVALYYQAAGGP